MAALAERSYTTIDKSDWGPGPWQDEPDKAQWKDDATGLPCLAVRNRVGSLCGYVGVSEGHPAFGKHYDEVRVAKRDPDDEWSNRPDVHGGLTYSAPCQPSDDESTGICHIPTPGEPDHIWWLGFDCAHSNDIAPVTEASNRKRYEETRNPIWLPLRAWPTAYRTLDYVRRECASLACQLQEIESGN